NYESAGKCKSVGRYRPVFVPLGGEWSAPRARPPVPGDLAMAVALSGAVQLAYFSAAAVSPERFPYMV
ncbi:MAG: hypothetical protein AAFV54_10515, partial [Pseudomonadota bacterium]